MNADPGGTERLGDIDDRIASLGHADGFNLGGRVVQAKNIDADFRIGCGLGTELNSLCHAALAVVFHSNG